MKDFADALWLLTMPRLDLILLMYEMAEFPPERAVAPGMLTVRDAVGFDYETVRRYVDIRARVPDESMAAIVTQLQKAAFEKAIADTEQIYRKQQQHTSKKQPDGGSHRYLSKHRRRRSRRRR